jgi:hypothetical protein
MTISAYDQDLLVRLGDVAAQADPVPDLVLDLARAAWETRALDAELLRLVAETTGVPAGVRSVVDQPRVLSFDGGGLVLDLQVERAGPGVRLVGQVLPWPEAGGTVTVEQPDGSRHDAVVGELGDFVVEGLALALLRLHLQPVEGAPLTTGWIAP